MKTGNLLLVGAVGCLSLTPASGTADPQTSDLDFLVGTWNTLAKLSPGTDREVQEIGTRTCEYTMAKAYVVCVDNVKRTRGDEKLLDRIGYNYHNYNSIYKTYESIFLNSNWPIKPIARFTMRHEGENLIMESLITFPLPGDITEFVKTTYVFDGKAIEATQHIRLSNEPEDHWRYNFWEKAEKVLE